MVALTNHADGHRWLLSQITQIAAYACFGKSRRWAQIVALTDYTDSHRLLLSQNSQMATDKWHEMLGQLRMLALTDLADGHR
jgi:hypothetical protein